MNLQFIKECFQLSPESPSWVKWKTRPRHHFATDGAWKKFNSQFAGRNAGTKTSHGYWQIYTGKTIGAHRVVWAIENNEDPSKFSIDHIDCNGLNNDPKNLRIASLLENSRNRRVSKNKRIQLKGVEKSKGKFRARIYADGRTYRLGTFDTPEQAHAAYCSAADTIHKTFARHA
jgi:hypothetical protein